MFTLALASLQRSGSVCLSASRATRPRRGRAPVAAWRWLITLALAGLSGGLYAMLLIGLLADPSCMGATF